jgi:hypothetical protein
MTNTKTTTTWKNNHYLGALVALAALAMVAMVLVAKPSYAVDTFTVTNTNDSGAGSLRQAILDANATDGASVIGFDIPGTGVKTIAVGSQGFGALPTITEPVTIDGYTQPGSSPNTKAVGNDASLKIQLDGTNAPGASGLAIVASNSVVKGLVINRFSFAGIFVNGATVGDRIEGNFVGTDPTGTIDRGNGFGGVDIEGDGLSQAVVGGTTPAARNLISGNAGDGVFMSGGFSGARADSLRVQGNYVGTDRSGTKDLGNDGIGLSIEAASNTTVGGTTSASRNVVSANGLSGVDLVGASDTKMLGNRIGTTAGGTGALGNAFGGVFIEAGSSNNRIGDGNAAGSNIIAFNAVEGIGVDPSSAGTEISRNSIFSNAELGIDLQRFQNVPVLTSAKTSSTKTTVKGSLQSSPNQNSTIEFFSNPKGTGEGKKFIGQKTITTGADGLASFTYSPATKVAVGQTVTATATNTTTHDTSAFSAPRTVASS